MRIILKWIVKKWTEFMWFRIGARGNEPFGSVRG
jgi:hypothetical protein